MDSTNFEDFNSPAGGVELSDTLSDWRKKTNGIIEKIDSLETKVETSDVTNNSLVLGKIEQISNLKVLGNTSGSTANVSQISVLDQDTLSSNSATALATQQSIKAYVDNLFDEYSLKEPTSNATGTIAPSSGSVFITHTSWLDVDLSSGVGSNKALVVLSVQDSNQSAEGLYFRTKGETFERYTGQFDGASSLVVAQNGIGAHIVLMTDSAGKIQCRSQDKTVKDVDYKILAFQKQRV